MNAVRLNAYAKLNLTLDITGTAGGYHLLDSLVTTVNLSDKILVKKRKDNLIRVTMHGMGSEEISPENNNAFKAGEAFVNAFHTTGADITIYKNIPVGAGMGGSSADLAGVLCALGRLYETEDGAQLKALADGLGSDSGYLMTGGFARMRGRGEAVEKLTLPAPLYFLVLCPKTGVNTRECYARYDALGGQFSPHTERALIELSGGRYDWAGRLFHNDLYEAAKSLNPAVEEAYNALKGFSPLGVGMTGSGSGCFALFESEELAAWAKSRYRGKARAYVLKSIEAGKHNENNPFALNGREG